MKWRHLQKKTYAEYIKMKRWSSEFQENIQYPELKTSSLFHTVFTSSKNSTNENHAQGNEHMNTDNKLTIKHWSSSNSQFRISQSSKQRKKNPKKWIILQRNTPPKVSTSSNYCSQRQSKTTVEREREAAFASSAIRSILKFRLQLSFNYEHNSAPFK